MTRPVTVTICGQPFALETAELGENEAGRTHVLHQRFLIADNQAPLQERDTVLHEIIHAVGQMTGHEVKEGAAAAIGTGLLAVLRGNPELVAWLVES